MPKPLRLALIGCGGNGRMHLRRMVEHNEVEMVALADPSADALDAAAAVAREATTFKDYRKLLKAVELDGVVISTPHTQHKAQVIDALKAGLHVQIEKPLCCSVADTKKIAAAAKKARRHVVIAYQRRWSGLWNYIRNTVRDKSFGRPQLISSFLSQAWLTLTRGKWRQVPELAGGGMLNDSGAHLIDMIFWVMPSRPTEVAAFIDNRKAKVDIDSAITYRFANGCLGTLTVVGDGPRPVFWEDVTISGSGGRAVFMRDNVLTIVDASAVVEVKKFAADNNPDRHFVDVLRGRAENGCPPEAFLPNIAFTEACWKSAAQGGKVVKVKY